MSLNQKFGYLSGAVYIAIGLVGFAITMGVGFGSTDGKHLLLFEINPLHNIIHIAVGALLMAGAAGGLRASSAINTLVGAVYLLVGLAGLAILDSDMNILALNHADNLLHLGTAVLALTVGLGGERLLGHAPAEGA